MQHHRKILSGKINFPLVNKASNVRYLFDFIDKLISVELFRNVKASETNPTVRVHFKRQEISEYFIG